jgi:uncharacterized membrane protein
MTKKRLIILKLSITALMTALIYVITAFLPIPYAGGSGYLNFSDGLIMFTTIFIGPVEGISSAIISCALADLTAGAANFIPFTIIAKGLEALICYLLFKLLKNHNILKYISCLIAPLFMILTYMISYLIMFGKEYLINSIFDLIQGIAGTILSIILIKAFGKIKLNNLANKNQK